MIRHFCIRRRCALVFAAAAASTLSLQADEYWQNGIASGNWNSAGNWGSSGYTGGGGSVPASSDIVWIQNTDESHTITLNTDASILQLRLGAGSGFTNTLSQTAGNLSAQFEVDSSVGNSFAIHTQSGGTTTYSGYLSLGNNAGDNGTYNLSGTATLSITGSGTSKLSNGEYGEAVGYSGTGVFNQTGGVNTIGVGTNQAFLILGNGTASIGTYNLSNGASLSVTNAEFVGYGGTGIFNQMGGTNSTNGFVYVGFNAGSSGAYNLSAGTFNIAAGESEFVGYSGNGTFTQSGGTHSASAADLLLGGATAGSGTYTLSSGVLTTDNVFLGDVGNGIFNQSGGTHTTQNLYLAFNTNGTNPASFGSYSLSNGAVLNVSRREDVGEAGNGVFNQTGGSNNMTGGAGLFLGVASSASGTYTLSGGLLDSSSVYVGNSGHGVFSQSAGTNSTALLYIGYTSGASGTYTLSGGTLNGSNTSEYVGLFGSGAFNQSGGTNSSVSLLIAYTNSASGTYTLSAGNLIATNTTNNGLFSQTGGTSTLGTVTGSGTMTIGGVGLPHASAKSFRQANVSISGGGYFAVSTNAAAVTNSATTLSITGSGQLDLSNNNLLTNTSPSTIRQYLVNGFNNGHWNGTGGISSANAAADYTSNGASAVRALGYTTGTSTVGIGLGLTSGQTLVKFTIYGDANLSGQVDVSDLNIVLNNFLGGNTWDTGDMYYGATTDVSDLNAVLNNFFATTPTSVKSHGAASGPSASVSTAHTLTGTVSPDSNPGNVPTPAQNTLELAINLGTGDVQIIGNNTQTGDTQITSSSNGIITAQWHDLKSQGYSNWSDTAKKTFGIGEFDTQFAASGDFALINDIDYGNIYNTTTNAEDYVFKYGAVDPNTGLLDTLTGSVYYYAGVPEPTTLSLLGIGAVGLLARRRRNGLGGKCGA